MGEGCEVLASYDDVVICKRPGEELPVYTFREPQNPLESLRKMLLDDDVEEIVFNGPSQGIRVYHRELGVCAFPQRISSSEAKEMAEYLAREAGQDVGSFPILEGRLRDGSRVSVILSPVAVDEVCFSIRKFPRTSLTLKWLVERGMLSAELAATLWVYIDGLGSRPANILIAGGTGSGKTTLLSALAQLIPSSSRIVIIEDTPEIRVAHPNTVRLTVPPPSYPHRVELDSLLRASLRLRPDRIIVGEVRGREAETLLAAMNTGHLGSMGTIHANTSMEAVKRLTSPPMNVPPAMLDALDLIITTAKLAGRGGRRVVLDVSEVAGSGQAGPRLNALYKYSPAAGVAVSTKIPSNFRERLISEAGTSQGELQQLIKMREQQLAPHNEDTNKRL